MATKRHTHNRDGKPFTPEFQAKVNRLFNYAAYAYAFCVAVLWIRNHHHA